jgi:RNA recognition motif-containing protein
MVAIEPIEEMRDYRDDDLSGRRLFVTGLPSSIDDVRLYLAFEGFGRITEAHVAKPGLGFVVYDEVLDADGALEAMEGTEISGKEIKVISCARCCIAACARSPSFPGALLS